jgi:KDO2-lipid IV(A) lauroyltransferase
MPRQDRRRLTPKRLVQLASFGLVWPLLALVGLAPFWLNYLLADFLRWVMFDVLKYRRRLAAENLLRAFPQKSDAERARIQRAFERNFMDNLVEGVKLRYAPSAETIFRRITQTVTPGAAALLASAPRVVVGQGHLGQLDWSCFIGRALGRPSYYVYKELQHPDFDRMMFNTRSRTGSVLYEMGDAKAFIAEHQAGPGGFVFIADQAPMAGRGRWVPFFGEQVPFFEGMERFARQYSMPVLYHSVRQLARGRYAWTVEVLVADLASTPEGGITAAYAQRLEREIIENPELWWWSHKRWKHNPLPPTSTA